YSPSAARSFPPASPGPAPATSGASRSPSSRRARWPCCRTPASTPEESIMAVEVILRDDVPNLGKIGDVVRVKPGYARNYLLPRGLAIEANSKNLRVLEHQKRVIAATADRDRKTAEAQAKHVDGLELHVRARAGEEGRLFGSGAHRGSGRAVGGGDQPRHRAPPRRPRRRRRPAADPARRAHQADRNLSRRDPGRSGRARDGAGDRRSGRLRAGVARRTDRVVVSRQALEDREAAALAPYAMPSRASR